MATPPKMQQSTGKRKNQRSSKRSYTIRLTNVLSGTQEDVRMPASSRARNAYSLWPAFTAYIVGFALLSLSFIAHTLKLYWMFVILLALAAGVVFGTATVRAMRRRG